MSCFTKVFGFTIKMLGRLFPLTSIAAIFTGSEKVILFPPVATQAFFLIRAAYTAGRRQTKAEMDLSSTVRLNDGVEMPLFGLGMYLSEPGTSSAKAVSAALKNGYKLIDTAIYYKNESDVAEGIKDAGFDRKKVFIVDKVFEHGYDCTIQNVKDSLAKLQTDYVDLFLIHFPLGGKNVETYKALHELKKQGLIRSVGVSNFGIDHLKGLEEAGLPLPSVNQFELHPFMKREDLVKYCKDKGIVVMGWAPLARSKKNDDPDLVRIAQKHGKSVSQVLLRWSIQKGYITIPKSTNPERIVQNTKIFDFKLSDEDLAALGKKPDDFNAGEGGFNPLTSPWEG